MHWSILECLEQLVCLFSLFQVDRSWDVIHKVLAQGSTLWSDDPWLNSVPVPASPYLYSQSQKYLEGSLVWSQPAPGSLRPSLAVTSGQLTACLHWHKTTHCKQRRKVQTACIWVRGMFILDKKKGFPIKSKIFRVAKFFLFLNWVFATKKSWSVQRVAHFTVEKLDSCSAPLFILG